MSAARALGKGTAGNSEPLQPPGHGPLAPPIVRLQDPRGKPLQAQGESLGWECPGLPTPPALCQPHTHHFSILDTTRIGPAGSSSRGPWIPLLVSAVHILWTSGPCLGFALLRILPYSHKRNEEGRVRESDVKDQNQMEETLARPDSLQWEEEKVFPSSGNEDG